MKYLYKISGYYWHGQCGITTKDHFDEEIEAENNDDAMNIVVGKLARKMSFNEETFELDFIHYEVLEKSPYDDPDFKLFVAEAIATEEAEPFCPFSCMYCHCAYSNRCLKCEEALNAFLEK